jgi:hypothetical protein
MRLPSIESIGHTVPVAATPFGEFGLGASVQGIRWHLSVEKRGTHAITRHSRANLNHPPAHPYPLDNL